MPTMRSLTLVLLGLSSATATHEAPAPEDLEPSFNLYIPLPDEQLLDDIFEKINSRAQSPVTSMISVAVPTDGTVVWYDHWEDGYDTDLTQGTTKVWGDRDASNGCAPTIEDCTDETDVFHAGDVVLLENQVHVDPRNPNVIKYDGGDLIRATYPVVMTRAGFPAGPGSMMAGAVEVLDQSTWGTSFEAPVGEDIGHVTKAYEFTAMVVMAGEDGTEIMKNGGSVQTLDQGGSVVVQVDQSDVITSSNPVQVHLITGDISSTYELRWYALAPTSQWSTTAYAPVGDTTGEVKVTIYNPSTTSIDVEVTYTGGQSDTITVPAKGHAMTDIIQDNVGAKFESEDIFFAFSSTDTEGSGQIFDWGYPLMTGEMLTPQIVVGLGFGCTGNSCDNSGERSIVWVMPVDEAELWIDYDNDGTPDRHITSDALQSHMLTDDSDEDMSGAVIWATTRGSGATGSGVNLAGAWGQKAALSGSGDSHALDLGTVVVPFEPTYTSCSIDILEDNDGDGVISTGDLVEETIEVLNVGNFAVDSNSFAVSTGGGVVNLDPMEIRGDTAIYKTQYLVPVGETVLGSCELVPYEPDAPVAPEPTPPPTTGSPTKAPTEAPKSPPSPDSPTPEDKTTEKVFTKGDPHFKTFGGELYDYHGECDLVLLHNPDFKEGLGMDIHIRTKIEAFWSSVESAVIKLGAETIEIRADPLSNEWLWVDGKEVTSSLVDGEWHNHQMAGFLVRYKQSGPNTREINLYLKGSKEVVLMKTFKTFVRVDLDWQGSVNYKNAVGLLGSQAHKGKRLGRDGEFIEDANTFGQEWQVRPEVDGSLFHSYEGAVVGKQCVLPPVYHEGDSLNVSSLRGRRLGASALDTAAAEKACNHLVDPEEIKACVFDVIATQDLSMASTW